MKKIVILLVVAMAALFSGSCKDKEIDGGWTSLDINGADVRKAAAFLQAEIPVMHPDVKIGKILSAEVQTVAGEKFNFEIEYTSDINKSPKIMKVKLFLSLEGKYSLKEIKFE